MPDREEIPQYLLDTIKGAAERCRASFEKPTPDEVTDRLDEAIHRLRCAKERAERLLLEFHGGEWSHDHELDGGSFQELPAAVHEIREAKEEYDAAKAEYDSYPHDNDAYDRPSWSELCGATDAVMAWALRNYHGLHEVDSKTPLEGFPEIRQLAQLDAVLADLRSRCINAYVAGGTKTGPNGIMGAHIVAAARGALAWVEETLKENSE